MSQQWGLILLELDNLVINNYWRKYYTYLEIGWDDQSIRDYLGVKENALQIASFNTTKISFSASSRRNRFYEVYNRENMLDQDVAWEGVIPAIEKLNKLYKIFIVSSRTTDLKEKTLSHLKKLGFPLEIVEVIFKEPNEALHNYRVNTVEKISQQLPSGIGICLQPTEGAIFTRCNYTPVAFASIKNHAEFDGQVNVVCQDWTQILQSLNCA